jgi:sugar lactone lactonase YvrE
MGVLSAREPELLVKGLAVGESPRWHAGRLWLSNWGAQEVVAVELGGRTEVMARIDTTVPFSLDWLPDGRLLIVSGREAKLLCRARNGSFVTHADLRGLSRQPWNEITVDARGNIYVNCTGFDFGKEAFHPGMIALVTPDGAVRQVADDIAFPNGMVITPDNRTLIIAESFPGRLTAFDIESDGGLSGRRTWAELGRGGDGICMDADGAIWSSATVDGRPCCLRVREGGQVLDRIETANACFACMLGGDDGRTLFMLTAAFESVEKLPDLFRSRTGEVWTARAPAAHAGRP